MARPRLGDGETHRLHMMITKAELDAIDAWQEALGLASRAEAVRRLCAVAMLAWNGLDKIASMIEELSIIATDDNEYVGGHFRGLLQDSIDGNEHGFSYEEAKDMLDEYSTRAYWLERNSRYTGRVVAGLSEAIVLLTDQQTFTAAQRESSKRLAELNQYIGALGEGFDELESHNVVNAVLRRMTPDERQRLDAIESRDERLAFIESRAAKYRASRANRKRRLKTKIRKEDEKIRETFMNRIREKAEASSGGDA